jgi:XTP/dITP diphosphohydrolase
MEIIIATKNLDKLREIQQILSAADLVIKTPADLGDVPGVIEDGDTLHANAIKKAREIRAFTGMSALADDSGLEVDALDGAPGVFSSRYAGEDATYDDNCNKLLKELDGVPLEERAARFRCVMALALTGKAAEIAQKNIDRLYESPPAAAVREGKRLDVLIGEGISDGRITLSRRGTSGFGYDPVFEIPHLGQTFAEMESKAKNRLSHRYRALVEMREIMIRLGLIHEHSAA